VIFLLLFGVGITGVAAFMHYFTIESTSVKMEGGGKGTGDRKPPEPLVCNECKKPFNATDDGEEDECCACDNPEQPEESSDSKEKGEGGKDDG
jgi:hypothetical protein